MSGVVRLSAAELLEHAAALPPDRRGPYLDTHCSGDASLRAEVESLLAHMERAGGFLSKDPFERSIGGPDLGASLPPGTQVCAYRIERVLGEGGMGIVYLAQQENPARAVALKVIRPGAASPSLLKRFRREAQLLGRLQHPGIAQIFEAGTAVIGAGPPQPFLAMEFIRGRPLTEYAREHGLDTRARLDLMARVCDAAEHAHQRGLIHRDLKPGNILVDDSGQPKILDFGVARALDQPVSSATLATDAGQLIGTVAYMSPEQVGPNPASLDARSDVYALGVILYELLSGQLPHDVRDKVVLEAARSIREDEPSRLSAINRVFRGDIETIALKALEKDRTRRYPSAAAMAEDIRRHLAGEPIRARQDSAMYVLQMRLRRYRWLVAAGVFCLALTAAFAVWASAEARAFRRVARSESAAKTAAIEHQRQAERRLRTANIERGRQRGVSGDLRGAEDLLWAALTQDPQSRDGYWALWELYARFPLARTISGHSDSVRCVRFSPDGSRLASVGADGAVNLWDSTTGVNLWHVQGHSARINTCRFTPDGGLLATAGLDSVIRLWHTRDGSPAGELAGHSQSVTEIDISADGTRLISSSHDTTLRLWDLATLREVRRFPCTGQLLWCVALDRAGRRAFVGDHAGAIQVLDLQSGDLIRSIAAHTLNVLSLSIRNDGAVLASSAGDGTIALWNCDDGSLVKRVAAQGHTPRSVVFSPDGAMLVASCTFATALLDAATLQPLNPDLPELQDGWSAAFTPDGRLLATTSNAPPTVRLWTLPIARPCTTIQAHPGSATVLASSPDGSRLATGSASREIAVWSASDRAELRRWSTPSEVRWLAIAPDNRRLAAAFDDGRQRIYDMGSGALLAQTPDRRTGPTASVAFLDGGRRLVSGALDGSVRLWDAQSGAEIAALHGGPAPVLGITVSADDRWILATARDAIVRLWDARDASAIAAQYALSTAYWNPVLTPDARYAVAGDFGGELKVWDTRSGAVARQLLGHTRFVYGVALSPDGALVCSASHDGTIRIWDTQAGECMATLRGCGRNAMCSVWIPGTTQLAVSYNTGDVELWDLDFATRFIEGNTEFQMSRPRPEAAAGRDQIAAAIRALSPRAGLARAQGPASP